MVCSITVCVARSRTGISKNERNKVQGEASTGRKIRRICSWTLLDLGWHGPKLLQCAGGRNGRLKMRARCSPISKPTYYVLIMMQIRQSHP